jgi:hypothetical protein
MPLSVGTWTLNADGTLGSLAIGALTLDTSGNAFFTGTATSGSNPADNITGFWDETGQAIAFLRLQTSVTNYSFFQVYTGKLFSFKVVHTTNTVTTFTLAGDVRDYSLTSTTPPTIAAPGLWCAQIVVTVTKTEKDGKDVGKDTKEGGKDKEHLDKIPVKDADKVGHLEQSALSSMGSILLADQLAPRLDALAQQMSVGRSFIAPDERPAVGAGLSSSRA